MKRGIRKTLQAARLAAGLIKQSPREARALAAWLLGRVPHWTASPLHRFFSSLSRIAGRRQSPGARRLLVLLQAILKHREILYADKMNFRARLSGPVTPTVLRNFVLWQHAIRSRNPEIPGTLAVHGTLVMDSGQGEQHIDTLLGMLAVSSNFTNFSIFFSDHDERQALPAILTKTELARVNAGGQPFDLSDAHPHMAPEIEAGGVPMAFRPNAETLRQTNSLLKAIHPRAFVVALSLPEGTAGLSRSEVDRWLPFLADIHRESPGIAFCILNRFAPETSLNLLPGVTATRSFGLSHMDAITLAQIADFYIGPLDCFGLAALSAGRAGVYQALTDISTHRAQTRQWILTGVSPETVAAPLAQVTRERRPDLFAAGASPTWAATAATITPTHIPQPTSPSKPATHKPPMNYYIDVFGYCNLRCPSCPVGNWTENDKAYVAGMMPADLLDRILRKAIAETEVKSIGLYNWTEPLLNPDLPALVRMVKSHGLWCSVSSNLNVLRNEDELLSSGLDWMRISVSGFTQEIYQRGHKHGDIETVKQNLRRLAEARHRTSAKTDIEVFFHRYIDNAEDELPMKEFVEDMGFRFVSAWAYFMPVEKMLSVVDDDWHETKLTDEDRKLIARLALPPQASVDITSKHIIERCDLYDFMTIDVAGEVYLCCASSGRVTNRIGKFLDTPLAELQDRKMKHSLCGPCLAKGIPVLYGHADPALDDLAQTERQRWHADQTRV